MNQREIWEINDLLFEIARNNDGDRVGYGDDRVDNGGDKAGNGGDEACDGGDEACDGGFRFHILKLLWSLLWRGREQRSNRDRERDFESEMKLEGFQNEKEKDLIMFSFYM